MNILVTGAAGFIGFHVCQRLLEQGHIVVGVDNLNSYYDPLLKRARLEVLRAYSSFSFFQLDVADQTALEHVFRSYSFENVIHLAAQAGVRYSLENAAAYAQSNLIGFLNVLEECRKYRIQHLTYASTSSVYGANTKLPFSAEDAADHPISFYAATKRANELMAHSYSYLYKLPTTGLRFFTVYGPWGRPDMALFKFTHNILRGEPIEVYNHGHHKRDFTYIDDIVEGVVRVSFGPPKVNSSIKASPAASTVAPWRVYNIGNTRPVELMRYIEVLEKCLGKTAEKIFLERQPGDVADTQADVTPLVKDFDYHPSTSVEEGVSHFVRWYLNYYKHTSAS